MFMRSIKALGSVVCAFLLLTACQFGRSAEEIINSKNDVERELTFTFSATSPGGGESSGTRVSLVDEELEGVRATWEDGDAIAMFDFGEVFVTTNGSGSDALILSYVEEDDHNENDGIHYANFKGQGLAKMGEDVFNKKPFGLLYPASDNVKELPCATLEAPLSFVGQDGDLLTLSRNFLYAWGYAYGVCKDDEVTLYENQSICSSNLSWHPHVVGSDSIILDNKMCIIRFSMVKAVPNADNTDSTLYSLQTYLSSQNLEIDSIIVANIIQGAPGISQAMLNLQMGEVTADQSADSALTLIPTESLKEITEENATPVSADADAERVAWGSTFYLAVPCPSSTKLNIQPLLTVHTRSSLDHHTPGTTYFGIVSSKEVKEGDYYMTAPIEMVDDLTRLQEAAKIYLYYHSSFVWNQPIDIY